MKTQTLQRIVGWIFLLPLGVAIIGLLRWKARYRIKNLGDVRKQFKAAASQCSPLIICPNHLTLIDSVLLHWALAPLSWYIFHYRHFSWNLPAKENVEKKLSWRIITFVTKCMSIDRLAGTDNAKEMLDNVRNCLRRGDLVTIFPEGTRSRSGNVEIENVTYGVGKIIQSLPECRVLCVYLRGEGQGAHSDYPRRGERFDLQLELIQPRTASQGLRAVKEISHQVINKLKSMEELYLKKDSRQCQAFQ